MTTAVLLYHHFSEYELSVALSVLRQGNERIVTVGLTGDVVEGEAGLRCIPDLALKDLHKDEIRSVLLPGCEDIGCLVEEEELYAFLKDMEQRRVLFGAICSAPFLLAKAGVLNGKKYTVAFPREQRDVIGVFDETNYVEAPVVLDGHVLTAKGPYFIDFANQFGKLLGLQFSPAWYR